MTNRDFAQLVLGSVAPTLEQRENVVRQGLRDWHYESSYVRVHAIKATSKSAVYAAVSFEKNGERFLTYAVTSLKCRRKDDGFWLSAETFLAVASTPFTLSECPREIFQAGESTGLPSKVDGLWYSNCMLSLKTGDNAQAMKKGRIFQLDSHSPAITISGERATYAVMLSKKTARYVAPAAGQYQDGDATEVAQNYSPVFDLDIPTFTDSGAYTEAGELLFDLSGAMPILKGRLAVGAKAAMIVRQRQERDLKLGIAAQHFNFAATFKTGSWLA